jgi:hypothetical protein
MPACTDLTTKPWIIDAGTEVLNQPFCAKGNIATAGGCMSSQYLAPVGEKEACVSHRILIVSPYI